MQQSRLPFNITLESLEELPILEEGRNHSYTGVKMVFRRNNLGLLTGGFYFPTLVFALLSLLSFVINPEVVSYCITVMPEPGGPGGPLHWPPNIWKII